MYIIIDKLKKKKYAVAVYSDGRKEVYDELDKKISFNSLVKKLGM